MIFSDLYMNITQKIKHSAGASCLIFKGNVHIQILKYHLLVPPRRGRCITFSLAINFEVLDEILQPRRRSRGVYLRNIGLLHNFHRCIIHFKGKTGDEEVGGH